MSDTLTLIEIAADGNAVGYTKPLTPTATDVAAASAALLQKHPRALPWSCYFVARAGELIGACGYKMPPTQNRVEIAYFTFPPNEGHGIGTAVARMLVELARRTQPGIVVFAQTLPQDNASTAILRKLRFTHTSSPITEEDGPVWEWELATT